MAESIALYFHYAQQPQLQELLDSIAQSDPLFPSEWSYPKGDSHVRVYPYDELLNEFEDDDLDELLSHFDGLPTAILCIEFQASHGMKTCESASKLAELLLRKFGGVVDDLYGQYWTDGEIHAGIKKETGSFAQSVRYPQSS